MKKVNLPFKLQSLIPGREFINHGMGHYNVTLKNFSSNIFFKFTKKTPSTPRTEAGLSCCRPPLEQDTPHYILIVSLKCSLLIGYFLSKLLF